MERPRLGDHVRARRHTVGEETLVVLHDDRGPALQIGVAEWEVLRQADGSRDLEGIRIAAARAGVNVSPSELGSFFSKLGGFGFFDRLEDSYAAASFAVDLPVVSLPGYRFYCSSVGHCCRSFGTILFRTIDIARARAAVPELDPVFMPDRGVDERLHAVEQHDGRCAYLGDDGRCRIHAAAGASAKPIGCRSFPARYVDTGDEIRVSPRLECACIFDSSPHGEPLTEATHGSELPREVYVNRIPEHVTVGGDRWPRAAVVALCDSLEVPEQGDLAALCWELAVQFAPVALSPREALARVGSSAERLLERASFRSRNDLVIEVAQHTAIASRAGAISEARAREDESLYLRSYFFSVLGAERPVEADLRRLALVLWIARAFPPSISHPIALVEMLARGHGLDLET